MGLLMLCSLFLRCDCCDDDEPPGSKKDRVSNSGYAGVGDSCVDDYDSAGQGCGGSFDISETCASSLACCPSKSGGGFVCVASERCETSKPGEPCEGDRDCYEGYSCVGHLCQASLGSRCWSDEECVTGYCGAEGYCDYQAHDLWVPPADLWVPPADAGPPDADSGAPDSSTAPDQAGVDL
jgi:hypothetical protein